MVYLFPYHQSLLKTRLSPQEITERLEEVTGQPKSFRQRLKPREKEYGTSVFSGEVHPKHFKLRRIIDYRNSFLPVISGEIVKDFNHTHVYLTFRLSTFVYIFDALWLGSVLLVNIIIIYMYFTLDKPSFTLPALIPVFMLLFGYLLSVIPFTYEVNKAKKILMKLWEAEEVEA